MLTLLAQTLLAQPADPTVPGWTWALIILLAAALGALAWMFGQIKSSGRRLAQLTVEHESTTAAHRELLERERKQAKTLDEKRDEIRDLKRDLAAQKKKNHTAQEETKALRKDLNDLSGELAEARKQKRPAFAEKPAQPKKPEPVAQAAPKKEEPAAPAEQGHRVADLEAELNAKSDALAKDRTALREARSELKNLRKRVEGLRRIDLVTAGKIEVLEDKLHAMGRQYYDAVSELAALKGEVKPPRPRDADTASKRDELEAMADGADNTAVPPNANADEKNAEQTA